jgi:tetratricopeptide (TPR) repeat protein
VRVWIRPVSWRNIAISQVIRSWLNTSNTMQRYLRFFVVCLSFGVLPCSAQAQVPSKPLSAKADYSQEAFVIEQSVTKVVFENDGTGSREAEAKVRIQSDAGVQHFGILTFPYQGATENLDIDYVRTQKPDGTTVSTLANTAQDMPAEITRQAPFYSDLREKHVAVKGLSVGDVLEFRAYWRTTKPLSVGQFWYAYTFSRDSILLQEQLSISVPRDRAIKWKSPDVKPVIIEEDSRRIFTWTSSHPENKSSDQGKKYQEEQGYLAGRGKLPPPDVEISTFQTWDDIGSWYNSLQLERVKPSDEIRIKAAELVKGAADDNAKMHAIYNYVSTQFRYIGVAFGIGRYQPHSAAEVLSNQYGDCKDKHTLLASLLEAAGINAYPALINSRHDLDPDVPSPAQFDHLITAVPQRNGFVWLDTTAEVAPFGYLLSWLRDKTALVIPPGKASTLVTTVAQPPSKALETFKIEAKLNEDGKLEGKIERTASGDDIEVLLRGAFRRLPLPQWKDLVQELSYTSGFAGDVSEVNASSPEKTDEPFHFAYGYNRKDYPQWSARRISSPLPPMITTAPDSKPSHPILLGDTGVYRYESQVELPRGYSPQLPENVDIKEHFAEYHASYSFKGRELRTERTLEVKLREVPISEYEAYKKFAKIVGDDHDVYVALSSGGSPVGSSQAPVFDLPESTNSEAMRFEEQARMSISRHDPQSGIESLKKAVRADDKFLRAWVELGEQQILSSRFDEGIDSLQRAIALGPKQQAPRKLLAQTFMQLQRYDQAASVWESLIEIAANEDTFTGFGLALFKGKFFEESAAAFELAAERNPRSSDLQIKLGAAYLQASDAQKGIAALRKAIELNSAPEVLADVAFELADAKESLPEALEYARRAVLEEEEASKQVTLSNLQLVDVRRTQTLGTFWATLGWVYFRLNNLDEAERYLNAAWVLTQDPVIGDRLGQVYEEKHEEDAAMRTYSLAISASSNAVGGQPAMQETHDRLERLKRDDFSGLKNGSGQDLGSMRTVRLDRIVPGSASAEFFVIITAGPKVQDVRFISGSERLKSAASTLASVKFNLPFPDDVPTRIVRRGLLNCFPVTGCMFVLLTPDSVHSIN